MVRGRSILFTTVAGLMVQGCVGRDGPCPQFEQKGNVETVLIERAKARFLEKLIDRNKITSKKQISFFDDCCSIEKIETETAVEKAFGETFQYHIGISHHKSNADGSIAKYSYSSIVTRCGDTVGDGIDVGLTTNQI
ncbi:hypothetical protein GCM10009096_33820 [Parasphingorhabdus litoris]|uniref:Lipoprotein n=1 Tax=Parasphingorhabdus litoris TaxID=394733 RepID=A0ABP3KWU4_9SPHN|nr:hypothetical protein [Parasphingorhabdus litoris]